MQIKYFTTLKTLVLFFFFFLVAMYNTVLYVFYEKVTPNYRVEILFFLREMICFGPK